MKQQNAFFGSLHRDHIDSEDLETTQKFKMDEFFMYFMVLISVIPCVRKQCPMIQISHNSNS